MNRALLLTMLLAGCTGADLQAVQGSQPPPVDDKVALHGTLCTQSPTDEQYPVKILFAVDTSTSEIFTDQANQRSRAVLDVIDRYAGNPAVWFDVIAFDSVASRVTGGFTQTPDLAAISNRLSQSDRLTDYQGALGTIYAELAEDMAVTEPKIRARSKYVIIFFSDGVPDPHCQASLGMMQKEQVCIIDRKDWPDTFALPTGTNPDTGGPWTWDEFTGLYPDLQSGGDYNTPDQLVGKVEDIMRLQQVWNVNEIRLHTALLFNPSLPQAVKDALGLNREDAASLLQALARAGNGSYTEFSAGTKINFLNVNYASVKQTYEMKNLFVTNRNAAPSASGPVVDSDGDGLPDSVEDPLRLCASAKGGSTCRNAATNTFVDPTDSDGDGYTDFFEYKLKASGFDPVEPASKTQPCTGADTQDTDGDGLRDCEEAFLGTDPRLFDTDADRIPDGIEFRNGLDPLNHDDALTDIDSDGTLNLAEVLEGWDPIEREPIDALPPRIQYQVKNLGQTPDGRTCYDFTASNITLLTPRAFDVKDYGVNELHLVFVQGPPEDPHDFGTAREACVKAKFVPPDLKVPATGIVELTDEDFFDLGDPALTCIPPEGKPPPTSGP